MNKNQWVFIPIIAFLLVACGGGSRKNDPVTVSEDTLAVAIQNTMDNALLVSVQRFQDQATTLHASAQSFCSTPDTEGLNAAQQAWKELNRAWYRLALYNYGPLNDNVVFPPFSFIDSLRVRGTDYTATHRTDITNWLSSEETLDDAFFAGLTFQRVGLLALEVTLFETSGNQSQESADIVNDFMENPRKCEIAQGLSTQILSRAQYVQDDWTQQHRNASAPYRDLFLEDKLDDGTAPLTQMLTGAQEHLDYLKQRHVVTTAAQLSNYAWESVSASLDEVELLLRGDADARVSFFSLMDANGYGPSVDTVQSHLAMARAAIDNRDVTELEVALALLDGNFKREIPNGLEVELGINFTDGD